jgi:transposase
MTEKKWAQAPCERKQLVLYPQHLDEIITDTDPIRTLDAIFTELDWSTWEARYDGHRGQPPIHPRLIAGCIFYGIMRNIRTSRELEDATRNRIDFRWFLCGREIDHSTFAGFRVRFNAELKSLNQQISLLICERSKQDVLALVLDGTRIRADSDRHGARTAECLERLVKACAEELDKRLARLSQADEQEEATEAQIEALRSEIEDLQRKVKKYETALETARVRDEKKRKEHGKNAIPVRVPVTDPEAQLSPNKDGGFAPNYTALVGVHEGTGHIIYEDVLPDSDEGATVSSSVESVRQDLGNAPTRVSADSNFATGETLTWLDEQGVDAYMPTNTDFRESNPAMRPDPTQPVDEERIKKLPKKDGKFSHAAFIYDAEQDLYYCPAGQSLRPNGAGKYYRTGVDYVKYQCPGCAQCPMAEHCVKEGATERTLQRDEYQQLREKTGKRMATKEGQEIYARRAPVVEGVFAIIKHIMGVRRFLVRGLDKVRIEWSWICGAFNLKKLLRLMIQANQGPRGNNSGPTCTPTDANTHQGLILYVVTLPARKKMYCEAQFY